MKPLALLAALFLSAPALAADVPAPPTQLCVDDNCTSTPPPATGGIKWHPGHYMLTYRGESFETVLGKRIPEVCSESALQGIQFRAMWYDLESSKGTYTFGNIDKIFQAVEACGKRLVLQIMAVKFGTTDRTRIVPDYILQGAEYNDGVAPTSTGFIARLWEAPVMDRYIALSEALAGRYDNKPYFEGVILAETASGGIQDGYGYTADAWIGQLRRGILAMVGKWSKTNFIVFNNYIHGNTDSQFIDFVKFLGTNRAAIGGPDVLPPPHSGSKGERIYRGELGGTDMRGLMPAAFAVQTPELGGKEGTFTPKELYDHCVGTNRCSHMFWIRNTSVGGAEQKWDTGILPFIRQNSRTNELCPASYSSCSK